MIKSGRQRSLYIYGNIFVQLLYALQVWDIFGRALFTSGIHDYPVTSVSWSPDGRAVDFFLSSNFISGYAHFMIYSQTVEVV